jgi:hypothetical protein
MQEDLKGEFTSKTPPARRGLHLERAAVPAAGAARIDEQRLPGVSARLRSLSCFRPVSRYPSHHNDHQPQSIDEEGVPIALVDGLREGRDDIQPTVHGRRAFIINYDIK